MVERTMPAPGARVINEALGIDWSNWDYPTHLAYSQRAMIDFWPTDIIKAPETSHTLDYCAQQMDLDLLKVYEPGTQRSMSASQLLERRMYNDALLIMHRGQVVHESWRNGMQEEDRHVNHSTTKSLTTLLLGLAIDEGLVDPAALVTQYLPQFADLENWRKIKVQHALDMRTGLAYQEHYEDPNCICWSYFRATGYYPTQADTLPGYDAWIHRHMAEAECAPGYKFSYASPVTNALGLIAESVYGGSVAELLEQKIYHHIGAESDAWLNLDPSGVAVTEGQLSLHLRDFARWAALFLYGGKNLVGEQVVPAAFFRDIVTPRQELREAWQLGDYVSLSPEGQYRNQTYVLDGACTQMAMLGIHGQFALIDLERELLAVGYGSYPNQIDQISAKSMLELWNTLRRECPA